MAYCGGNFPEPFREITTILNNNLAEVDADGSLFREEVALVDEAA